MSAEAGRLIAASGVLIVLGCLFWLAIAPDPTEKRRKQDEAESRRRKLERAQRDKAEAMKLDGTHLFKRPHYKPAAAYLAPEKPEPVRPANVAPIRKAKR